MEGLYEPLAERVEALIKAHKHRLLSTTGTQGAITEVIERIEGLERAILEIAHEVEELAAPRKKA
jgi:uncharacterized protein (UPF0335 family)